MLTGFSPVWVNWCVAKVLGLSKHFEPNNRKRVSINCRTHSISNKEEMSNMYYSLPLLLTKRTYIYLGTPSKSISWITHSTRSFFWGCRASAGVGRPIARTSRILGLGARAGDFALGPRLHDLEGLWFLRFLWWFARDKIRIWTRGVWSLYKAERRGFGIWQRHVRLIRVETSLTDRSVGFKHSSVCAYLVQFENLLLVRVERTL